MSQMRWTKKHDFKRHGPTSILSMHLGSDPLIHFWDSSGRNFLVNRSRRVAMVRFTLPETNIAPETNRVPETTPLEKEIPIGNHHFHGRTVSFRECRFQQDTSRHVFL